MLNTYEEVLEDLFTFDREYQDMLDRQRRQAFGEKITARRGKSAGTGDYSIYEDLKVGRLEIGVSRDMLNNAVFSASKFLSGEPSPEYTELDQWTGEFRRQACLERMRTYNFQAQCEAMFMDGDNLGWGVGVMGYRRNRKSGQMCTVLRHCPSVNFIWDPFARTIGDARWCAAIWYLPPEEVFATYPKAKERSGLISQLQRSQSKPLDYIRVTEHWSLYRGTKDPTYTVLAGNTWTTREGPVLQELSKFEDELPVPYYEYISVPGLARPIGKILLQEATVEARNELQRTLRTIVKKGTGIDLFDMRYLVEDDVKRLLNGEPITRIRLKPDAPIVKGGNPPIMRIQNQEVSSALMALWGIYSAQLDADANKSATDPGGNTRGRLQTDLVISDTRAQQGQALTRLQVLRMYQRMFRIMGKAMAIGDRHPTPVAFKGYSVLLNDPARPQLWFDKLFEETSDVIIDAQSIESQDILLKRKQRQEELASISPLTQGPGAILSPVKYAEEALLAIGEKDPKSWMNPMLGGAASPGGPNMPNPMQLIDPNAVETAQSQVHGLPSGQMEGVANMAATNTA